MRGKDSSDRNSMADMVMEASNVRGATSGIGGVSGGTVDVASGIGGVGVGGTDSVGCSSYGAFLAYSGAATGAE